MSRRELKVMGNIHAIYGRVHSSDGMVRVGSRKGGVTRTVRMDDDVDIALKRLAEEQGLSVNALVGKVLRKYAEWDALVSKFGWVQSTSQFLERIMIYLSEDEARDLGRWAGTVLAKEYVGFWFKELSFENYLRGIRMLASGYAGQFRLEEGDKDGLLVFICQHGRGHLWSVFYEEMFKVSCRELFDLSVDVDVSENQVMVSVPLRRAPIPFSRIPA